MIANGKKWTQPRSALQSDAPGSAVSADLDRTRPELPPPVRPFWRGVRLPNLIESTQGVTTMKRIHPDHLRALRNNVPVDAVLTDLRIPTKNRGRRVNFRCPACDGFHAAINPQANLLRCFRCARDFNPIDLVEAACQCRFLEAVRRVESLMVPSP